MNEEASRLVLQDSAAPLDLLPDHGLWPWWLAAGVFVLLIIAAWAFLKVRKPKPVDITKLRGNAYREALAALDSTTAADAREAAVQTSLIVRKYLSIAASDPALYETHEEFISRQDALLALTADARNAAEASFSKLAALKYAPEIPGKAAAEVIAESRSLLETLHHGFVR